MQKERSWKFLPGVIEYKEQPNRDEEYDNWNENYTRRNQKWTKWCKVMEHELKHVVVEMIDTEQKKGKEMRIV